MGPIPDGLYLAGKHARKRKPPRPKQSSPIVYSTSGKPQTMVEAYLAARERLRAAGKEPPPLHPIQKPLRPPKPKPANLPESHNIVSGKKTKAQRRLERSFKTMSERIHEKNLSPAYCAYIGSPRWDATRRAYFQVVERRCSCCPSLRPELHHLSYQRLGHEWWCDLVPLCHACHERVHAGVQTACVVDSRREEILPT